MTGPYGLEPSELEGTPESRDLAERFSQLLARRAEYEKGARQRHPRRRVVGEVEFKTALEGLLATLGADPRPPLWRATVSCLAYTLAEVYNLMWDSAYATGYRVGSCEPEPTLKSAARAVGLDEGAWPTLDAFVEFYRERLELRAAR